ncbi:MAG: hypothetical protein KJ597_04650, partial [Nanoarchaeota archaeon]|nr:hypothetical protein [Nanoarchaeota archaeon]
MATTQFDNEIQKIFDNNYKCLKCRMKERKVKKKLDCSHIKKLSKEQLETLKRYQVYYQNKKSTRGGKIKRSSVWNSLQALRQFGVYLNKPYEKAKKQEIIDFFTIHLEKASMSKVSNWKVTVRSFYKWMH